MIIVPKNKKRIVQFSTNKKIVFPDNWFDFASSCKIRSGSQIVSFVPYDFQTKLVGLIEQNSSIMIAKTRQLGITETIANYFLWYACRQKGYLAVIFSKTQSDTSNIAKRLRRQIESLNLQTKTDSLTDIELVQGGRILFRNSTPYGSRGLESVSHILFDEASFIDEISEIYKSALPTTSMVQNSKIILLSTPNGSKGFYYDILNQNNDFNFLSKIYDIREGREKPFYFWIDSRKWLKVLIHYKCHPIYGNNENYLEDVKNRFGLDETSIQQEFNLSFEDVTESRFDSRLVKKAIGKKLPDSFENIIFGLDTSSSGNDYTVLSCLGLRDEIWYVFDFYRARQKSSDFHLFRVREKIEEHNPTLIFVETNSIGQIYYEKLYEDYRNKVEKIFTSHKSKHEGLARITYLLETEKFKIQEKTPYVSEFLNFTDGTQTYHDDCVMSVLVAIYGYHNQNTKGKIDLSKFYL